jgi:uncharacterized repeat protein (TIGR01451 family)
VTRTSGHVVGNLAKTAGVGPAVALTFEIGDASIYAPIDLLIGTVLNAGELTASTSPGDHPDLANSGLAPSRSVNRWWSVTAASLTFDTYDATFTFAPSDIDAGADPTRFVVGKLDGATWTMPVTGTRTATTTQATGMTSFSEFAIAELPADLSLDITDGQASVTAGDGLTYGYTITIANAGPSDATGVTVQVIWPAGFVMGALGVSQGTCALVGAGPDLTCDLGTLVAAGQATITLGYTVPLTTPAGVQTATAAVTSISADPDAFDASDSDDTTVIAPVAPTPTPTPTPTATPIGTPGASAQPSASASGRSATVPGSDTLGPRPRGPSPDATGWALVALLAAASLAIGLWSWRWRGATSGLQPGKRDRQQRVE